MPLNIDVQQIFLHMFNFVILFGGLYILLYKPVKDFMEKRTAYFKDIEDKALESQKEADELKASYDAKIADIQKEAADVKNAAMLEGQTNAADTIKKAREEAEKIMTVAKVNAEKEKQKAIDDAKDDITNMAIAAVKKITAENENPYDAFLDAAKKEM